MNGVSASLRPGVRSATLSTRWVSTVKDYWVLTKPEVNFLVLISTLVGFYVGARGPLDGIRLLHTLLGTLLWRAERQRSTSSWSAMPTR